MSVQCRGRKFAVKRESGVSPERSGHCKQGVLPYYAIGSIHLAQTTGAAMLRRSGCHRHFDAVEKARRNKDL